MLSNPDSIGSARSLIDLNFQNFSQIVERARHYMAQDDDELAILHCEAAAAYAIANHCGIFSSPNLERLIGRLGRKIDERPFPTSRGGHCSPPVDILHVCTHALEIGGSSRFVWRWVQEDEGRRHSVVLTRQPNRPVPEALTNAVHRCGGQVHHLDGLAGGFLSRAKRLAEIGEQADLVVLHTERDVLPLLAFANHERAPPMLFVDHGDHKFRLGLGSSSAVASLRESGMRLARKRKDVCASRNVLLPTLIEPAKRGRTRGAAKQSLGLPPDCVMLLCVARRVKFKTIGDRTYADLHRPLLENDPRVVLIVLGAGDRSDCVIRSDRTEDRIILMRERADTSAFYEAADIYLDSFPFVSITSLLEAGSRGVPLVSYFPHGEQAEIFGSDMPGLTGHLLTAFDMNAYLSLITALLADERYRRETGERTRRSIETLHRGASWKAALRQAYETAIAGHGEPRTMRLGDEPSFEAVDRLVPLICAQGLGRDRAIQEQLQIYSPWPRLRNWMALARDQGLYRFVRRGALRCFLPSPLVEALRHMRRLYRERWLRRKHPSALPLAR